MSESGSYRADKLFLVYLSNIVVPSRKDYPVRFTAGERMWVEHFDTPHATRLTVRLHGRNRQTADVTVDQLQDLINWKVLTKR